MPWLCLDVSAVDDVDYSAAETLRSIYEMLKEKGIHLVIAQVLDEVEDDSHFELHRLFGEDAFYDTLKHVKHAYQQHTALPT